MKRVLRPAVREDVVDLAERIETAARSIAYAESIVVGGSDEEWTQANDDVDPSRSVIRRAVAELRDEAQRLRARGSRLRLVPGGKR